jgi:hypothetical protein
MFIVKINGEERSKHTQLVDAYVQVDRFKQYYLSHGIDLPEIEIIEQE